MFKILMFSWGVGEGGESNPHPDLDTIVSLSVVKSFQCEPPTSWVPALSPVWSPRVVCAASLKA